MAKYAVIDGNGLVVNLVDWDGVSAWAPPEGCTAVQTTMAGPGWSFADGVFTAPPVEE